ncbi:alpha/beta fold hydrolase [Pseudomonas sp. L5B5]|uniref:thioesterase II family protein n=1 Tax=Pseudomonas sp. L5B5 TaxID=2883205 RepID=UPI000730A15C|nr:alpha/beta fold hydrolase [Pseudomonas sp. L5B5]KTC40849.1 thioesterase [Pseudomonas sp. ABAC61]UCZ85836.1 alpha/beta fold hydrolase [Pseudomonas sp. L5B5]
MQTPSRLDQDLWFPYASRPRGKMRLFTFPYAGSGASVFHRWFLPLYDQVDLYALQLPGREGRSRETPYVDLQVAANAVADCLEPFSDDIPCCFFGHSMGALLAFAVAEVLQQRQRRLPLQLVLSGMVAPHVPQRVAPLHRMPAQQATAVLQAMGGVPAVVLAEEDLMQMYLPIIQADIAMVHSHVGARVSALDTDITCLSGTDDLIAPPEFMQPWRNYTRCGFEQFVFPGGHFFLDGPVMSRVKSVLGAAMRQRAGSLAS